MENNLDNLPKDSDMAHVENKIQKMLLKIKTAFTKAKSKPLLTISIVITVLVVLVGGYIASFQISHTSQAAKQNQEENTKAIPTEIVPSQATLQPKQTSKVTPTAVSAATSTPTKSSSNPTNTPAPTNVPATNTP